MNSLKHSKDGEGLPNAPISADAPISEEYAADAEVIRLSAPKKSRWLKRKELDINDVLKKEYIDSSSEAEESFNRGLLNKRPILRSVTATVLITGTVLGVIKAVAFFNDEEIYSKIPHEVDPIEVIHQRSQAIKLEQNQRVDLLYLKEQTRLFYSVESFESLSEIIADFPNQTAILQKYYKYGKRKLPKATIGDVQLAGVFTRDTHQYYVVRAKVSAQEFFYLAFLMTPKGPKIDWKSLVVYQDLDWHKWDREALLNSEYAQRVQFIKDAPYLGGYDDQSYLSFHLGSPELDFPVYAYVSRNIPLAEKLLKYLEASGEEANFGQRAILKLKPIRKLGGSWCVEITDLVSESWVEAPSPHSEKHAEGK